MKMAPVLDRNVARLTEEGKNFKLIKINIDDHEPLLELFEVPLALTLVKPNT